MIGHSIHKLRSPAFLIHFEKTQRNCQRMIEKCSQAGIILRPHIKTHKTVEGALLQTGGRRSSIVVSTIDEARFFIENDFSDILLARPATEYVMEQCIDLQKQKPLLYLVNSIQGINAVKKYANTMQPVSVFVKISVGYDRAGISWSNTEDIVNYVKAISNHPGLKFQGLYAHCGDSYTKDAATLKLVREQSIHRLQTIRNEIIMAGFECPNFGTGSTPSCSTLTSSELTPITEVHPGNYIFYDCQQESYGSCRREDIAVRVMTRVVSHHPERNQIVVDLGFTGLTKQGFNEAVPGFGAIEGNPNLKLVAMTQELGKIETVDGSPLPFDSFPIDSLLFIYPYHACATAGMYREYYVHDNEGIVRQIWNPTRGW